MNDHELITLVREQRTAVPMTTPVDEIISRGRSVRARRRISGLTGALAAAAAVAAAALVPSGHQAPPPPRPQLAAWTVTKQADGDVEVTIRELRDPSALAAALRAAGVPTYVAFADPAPVSCQPYPASSAQLVAIYQLHQGNGSAAFVIDPSAIPSGAGLFILDVPATAALSGDPQFADVGGRKVHVGLVRASRECPVAKPSG
jgi:hypothetical protein